MSRSSIKEKIVLGILFGAVTITVIGYRRIYWRVYEQCAIVVEDNDYKVSVVDDHKVDKGKDIIGKVTVDVYYESLCLDSRSFVVDQLAPAVRLLGDRISLKLIPYGKSHTLSSENGKSRFRCQHGLRECLGNKYHSCIVARTSDNVTRQIGVVRCLFENVFSPVDSSAMSCSRRFGLDFTDIKICATGQEGVELLKNHGANTEPLRISFVPTIILNRVFGGTQFQNRILKDLRAEVCKILKYNSTDMEIDKICATNSDPHSE